MRELAVAAVALMMAGCAGATKSVVLNTEPTGALLTETGSGRTFQAPVMLNYSLRENQRSKDGCFHVPSFSARWPSGAEAPSAGASIPLCGPADIWHVFATRPTDAPRLEIDMEAAKLRSNEVELNDAGSRISTQVLPSGTTLAQPAASSGEISPAVWSIIGGVAGAMLGSYGASKVAPPAATQFDADDRLRRLERNQIKCRPDYSKGLSIPQPQVCE